MSRQNRRPFSLGLAEIRAHLDNIGIELYNGSRMVDLQVTHVAGIGVVFGWPTWRSPGHRKHDLEKHVNKLMELESASHEPAWIAGKSNLASTRKLYGIKWVDKVGWNPSFKNEGKLLIPSQQKTREIYEPAIYSRCLVTDAVNEVESIVCFIDYGDCALVKNSELFELEHQYAAIPLICKAFVLHEMPLKLSPLPTCCITRNSIFNQPEFQHMLKWLEDILANKVVEVVPTRDLRHALSHGKIRTYKNESGDFGVLLITLNGMNVNDEFKRELERANEKFKDCAQYDDLATVRSIPEEQLLNLHDEENSKMLSTLSQMTNEHKPKRKTFIWDANGVEKLLKFAQSVEKNFRLEESNTPENICHYWKSKVMEGVEIVKTCQKTIENINECRMMTEKLNSSGITQPAKNDISQDFQHILVSLKVTHNKIVTKIAENQDLTKLESGLLCKLGDLEVLDDEWKESFAFLKKSNLTSEDINPQISMSSRIPLENAITALKDWFDRQQQELQPLFDNTNSAVNQFCKEQKKNHQIRLKKIMSHAKQLRECKRAMLENGTASDTETTYTENESFDFQQTELRKKFKEAMSFIKKESQTFDRLNAERVEIVKFAQCALDKRLKDVGKTLENISNDLLVLNRIE